jgi:hypothetical protein
MTTVGFPIAGSPNGQQTTLTNPAAVGLAITGAPAQTGDYVSIENSAGTDLFEVDAAGTVFTSNVCLTFVQDPTQGGTLISMAGAGGTTLIATRGNGSLGTQAKYAAATDQTGSRALNTDYTNGAQRRTVHVTVTCAATVANAATAGYETTIGGTNFDFANDVGANAGVIESGNYQMTFEVDPGGTYAVNSAVGGTSTVVLVRWVEVDS